VRHIRERRSTRWRITNVGVDPSPPSISVVGEHSVFPYALTTLALLTLPSLARSEVSTVAERITLAFVALLIAGTIGAWMVMGMGLSSNSPWSMEPALPLLSVGTVLAALLAFLPVYRGLRKH
jgi:hypothetical protein